MTLLMLLFAQSGDPISGGAGWIGAGLLGAVLSWVFVVHLPAKDKQIQFLLEQGRILTEGLVKTHRESLNEVASNFRAVNEQLSAHCDKELERLARLFEEKGNERND
jgi:hypothetical protein